MPLPYTAADTIGFYHTRKGVAGTDFGLGGRRDSREIVPAFFASGRQIPPLNILSFSGHCVGSCLIAAKSTDTLAFTAPSGTEGTAATCAEDSAVLIVDADDSSKWARVYRDSNYSNASLGGMFNLEVMPEVHGQIGGTLVNVSGSVQNLYTSIMVTNHAISGDAATLCRAWVGTLGTAQLSNSTQLPGAGAGTITTATALGFAGWPTSGWARITTNAPALREIVYYTSRTDTALTVPAAGRGRLGTAAAAGASTDTVDCVPGIRIGYETADAFGEIQTIANATTAPAGITWSTAITSAASVSLGTLNPRQNIGLWIHREIPADPTVSILMENKINIGFTTSGTAYTNVLQGYYRIADASLIRTDLWLGVDDDPDVTLAPDATAAVEPSIVITPPVSGVSEYRITCRRTNEYGLQSQELDYKSIWINAAGAEVDKPIQAPTYTLENRSAGVAVLMANYKRVLDTEKADEWRIYYTTNGVDPDPGVDVPIEVLQSDSTKCQISQYDASAVLTYVFPTMDFNTDLRVIVRAYRDSDASESDNTDVVQLTINTAVGTYSATPQVLIMMENEAAAPKQNAALLSDTLGASGWAYTIHPEEYLLYVGTTVVMRSTIREGNYGRIFIPESFNLANVAHSAAASSTTYLIESVSATVAYILVGSTRRAKIDLTTGVIEAATFQWGAGITDDIPVNDYGWGDSTATYLLQYDPYRGRFVPWLKLTSAGVLSTAFPITQRRS